MFDPSLRRVQLDTIIINSDDVTVAKRVSHHKHFYFHRVCVCVSVLVFGPLVKVFLSTALSLILLSEFVALYQNIVTIVLDGIITNFARSDVND